MNGYKLELRWYPFFLKNDVSQLDVYILNVSKDSYQPVGSLVQPQQVSRVTLAPYELLAIHVP